MWRILSVAALIVFGTTAVTAQKLELSGFSHGFGDDSSLFAHDGDCDDVRFLGDRGASASRSPHHVARDATDCRERLAAGHIRWGTPDENFERERLFTHCAPVSVSYVLVFGEEVTERTLQERLPTLLETRLSSARIYGDFLWPMLDLAVFHEGPAFYWEMNFSKRARDGATGRPTSVISWRTFDFGTFGRPGDPAQFIVNGVSEALDEFIADYLRVNEEAC